MSKTSEEEKHRPCSHRALQDLGRMEEKLHAKEDQELPAQALHSLGIPFHDRDNQEHRASRQDEQGYFAANPAVLR